MARQESPNGYNFTKETGALAEMQAGKDSATSLSAGTVGEVAYVRVGDDSAGSFGAYDLLALGGIPEPERRNGVSKIEGTLLDGASAAASDGTQVRIRLTDRNRTGTYGQTDWFRKEDIEATDPAQRPTLEFEGVDRATFVKRGRVVVVEVRNQRSSTTVDQANSTLAFPYIGAF